MRHISGTEEVVPDAEGEAEVHSVAVVLWKVSRMVPDMHLGIIEEILQWTQGDS